MLERKESYTGLKQLSRAVHFPEENHGKRSQDRQSRGQELNPDPPVHAEGMLNA
jgi:hypothetical protein